MDYFWIIPLLIAGLICIWVLYLRIVRAGAGVRSEGRTLVDKRGEPPDDDEEED